MFELEQYLNENLGLRLKIDDWHSAARLPLFLSHAANYALGEADGIPFVIAEIEPDQSLPDIKRIYTQLAKYTDLPVAFTGKGLDARQRKALVSQGIPFVVPDVQAYLPFLAFAVSARQPRSYRRENRLSFKAQATLAALIARPEITSAAALREVTGFSPSDVSRTLTELDEQGLIERSKYGRSILVKLAQSPNELLRVAKPLLSSPVRKIFYIERNAALDRLPNASETALAERTMLTPPSIRQKAISRKELADVEFNDVLLGELDDNDTLELQVWQYEPLVAGQKVIDNVSLALSLADNGDERIEKELNSLFGEENLW